MPTTVLVYLQLGQFLMLVMVFSWLYSTFSFLAICNVIGPKNDFGQLSIARLFAHCGRCLRRVKPKDSEEFQETNELGKVEPKDSSNPINENEPGNVTRLLLTIWMNQKLLNLLTSMNQTRLILTTRTSQNLLTLLTSMNQRLNNLMRSILR